MSNLSSYLAAGAVMITLAGCASTPNTADIMRAHAADAQDQVDLKNQLAKDWSRGAKMVQSGEKRVKNGEKKVKSAENDLKDGQAQVEQGNQEIAEGRKLMQESEQHFHENFPKLELKSTN